MSVLGGAFGFQISVHLLLSQEERHAVLGTVLLQCFLCSEFIYSLIYFSSALDSTQSFRHARQMPYH